MNARWLLYPKVLGKKGRNLALLLRAENEDQPPDGENYVVVDPIREALKEKYHVLEEEEPQNDEDLAGEDAVDDSSSSECVEDEEGQEAEAAESRPLKTSGKKRGRPKGSVTSWVFLEGITSVVPLDRQKSGVNWKY